MSNRRRLPGRARIPHCAICARGIRAAMDRIQLRDGRVVCAGCRDAGCLQRTLSCGHGAVPGNLVVYEGGVFLCAACARESLTVVMRGT